MSHRTGRPKSDNSKDITIRCRIGKDLNDKLNDYCKRNNVTKTAVMIQGIKDVIEKE